jgi:uncharacterized protein with HEPN domain
VIRRLLELLADASDYARRAATYVEGIELADFTADVMRREAVCFCLAVVGEACDRASKELTPLPPDIPWPQIKAMRNILVHEYWQIHDVIIYNVAREAAPRLADQLDALRLKLGAR